MPLSPGVRFGSYEIVAPLGSGGMGEVYRARDTRLKRDAAIKVLPTAPAIDAAALARFEREAELLAALNHSNIAQVYGLEQSSDGALALAMELVEGRTLAERIAHGPLPVDEALAIALQVADALEAAHGRGIVHRDLKPKNVQITPDGTLKVLDFGIAKALDPRPSSGDSSAPTAPAMTEIGVVLGTAAYMSPEQARGRAVDQRTDIWAYGCVLYEMLTGQRAFPGEDASTVFARVLERDPDFGALPANVPRAVRTTLELCLQKDPRNRLADIRDVRLALAGAFGGAEPVRAEPRRHARAAILGLVVVGLASLGAVGWLAIRPVAPPVAIPARFEVVTPPESGPFGVDIAVSPDGRHIAFVAGATSSLFVRPIDALDARMLPGTEGATGPFWSPDGQHLGFAADGKLKRVALAGGVPETLADLGEPLFGGGTWGDAGVILFASFNAPLRRISALGGEPTVVTASDPERAGQHAAPEFLPDGRHFLFSIPFGSTAGVYVGSLDSSERLQLSPQAGKAVYASGRLVFNRGDVLFAQPFDTERLALVGEPTLVANGLGVSQPVGAGKFSVSRGGVLAYRPAEQAMPTRLTWYDRSGTPLGSIGEPGPHRGVALAPDGRRVAVHRHERAGGGDIWIFEPDRGTFARLTFETPHNVAPIWSPDGAEVLYTGIDANRFTLYRKRSNGAGAAASVLDGDEGSAGVPRPVALFPEDWSPDGERVLFVQGTPTNADIWVVPVAGGASEPLIDSPANERVPRFSPDGRWIAYVSNETGREEVDVTSYSDRSVKWLISTNGGHYPLWTRDGRELLYLADGNTFMAVDMNLDGDALSFGAPHALFTANVLLGDHDFPSTDRPYAVSADGERILVNERLAGGTEQATSPLIVVLNWDAELPPAP